MAWAVTAHESNEFEIQDRHAHWHIKNALILPILNTCASCKSTLSRGCTSSTGTNMSPAKVKLQKRFLLSANIKLIFLIRRGHLPDQSILNNHLPFRFAGYEILKRVVRHHHGCGSGSQFQDEAVVAGGGQRMGARADAAIARNRNDTTLLTELATT